MLLVAPFLFLLASGCEFDNLADEREFLSGPTNINAALGNGRLSAAFSRRGEVTVLRWPSPSYYDQLNYLTPILTQGARDRPRMGAGENMGILAGLEYTAGGKSGVTWFRDEVWTAAQSYLSDTTNILVTEYVHEGFALQVRFLTFALPDLDVLVFTFEVDRHQGSPVEEAALVFFENLSPCLHKIPNLPLEDWLLDFQNDFAALYDSRRDLLVHFRPQGGKDLLSRLDPLFSIPSRDIQEDVNELIDSLDGDFGQGVYVAMGSDRETVGHQVGFDEERGCEKDRPWKYSAQDAYLDALDGTLSGSPAAGCQANAALVWDLDLSSGSDRMSVYAAFSESWEGPAGALALLESSRNQPALAHLDDAESWWDGWSSRAELPDTDDPHILQVARRALLTIKAATDRETGAIVAGIATQPPYSLDWPRDGAFINHVLDLAGYPEMVTQHNLFYADVQRKEPLLGPGGEVIAPAGTYATNYYADGMEGMPIPFEIDNAGFAVWTMAEHRRFLKGAERASYLEAVWPAIRLGAEELANCRDEENGLQCYANEGDSFDLTQGLPGAISVHIALTAALGAGEEVRADKASMDWWRTRRGELKEAIIRFFWNEEGGYFEPGIDYPRGFVSWVIWPARFLPFSDPRMKLHAEHLFSFMEPHLRKETEYALYDAESASALAHIWKSGTREREKLVWALNVLTKEVPTPGTHHYGEVYTIEEEGQGKFFEGRTAIPHVWSASLVYLASIEAFDTAEEASEANGSTSGCDCHTTGQGAPVPMATIVLNLTPWVLPFLMLIRKKHRNRG